MELKVVHYHKFMDNKTGDYSLNKTYFDVEEC